MTVLERQFVPKVNTVVSRHHFRQRAQRADESVPQYLAALRELAATINFLPSMVCFSRFLILHLTLTRFCYVTSSCCLTNLGVKLDPQLTFTNHIKHLYKTCFFHIKNISKLHPFLTFSDAEKLVHALISCRLDYCNSLLIATPRNTSKTSLPFTPNQGRSFPTGKAGKCLEPRAARGPPRIGRRSGTLESPLPVTSGPKAQTSSISPAQDSAPWETELSAPLPLTSGTPSLNICGNPSLWG
ncbi:hypothetical protein N1851_000288 [Merluccius polli]|uniref:Uncharacterized protein n=1 Tax=Merluccius polli TaxID=89951 RepID=A0AA47NCA0_MERPO|nr:hypothetical protein N1851_000288 [Merluccius polli]